MAGGRKGRMEGRYDDLLESAFDKGDLGEGCLPAPRPRTAVCEVYLTE